MKRLILSFILFFSAASLHAVNNGYSFNLYQTRDGLPSNTVYCTMQDKNGFIWVGTDDGICVYYDPTIDRTINIGIHERVPASTIVVDEDGDAWFQFQSLYRYDKETEMLVKYPVEEFFRVSSLTVDSYGTPWCTNADTGELYRYEHRTDRFRKARTGGFRLVKGISDGKLLLLYYLARLQVLPHSASMLLASFDGDGDAFSRGDALDKPLEDSAWAYFSEAVRTVGEHGLD